MTEDTLTVIGESAGLPQFTAKGLSRNKCRHAYIEDLLALEVERMLLKGKLWSPFLLAELGAGV